MKRVMAVTVIGLLAAGGCAQLQWRKPGAGDAETAGVLESCRKQARERSFHELNARVLAQPYGTGMDRYGHATLAPPLSAEGDRVMMEQDLLRRCMRLQGYELVPREQRPGR